MQPSPSKTPAKYAQNNFGSSAHHFGGTGGSLKSISNSLKSGKSNLTHI
jgi:hypothetical protein